MSLVVLPFGAGNTLVEAVEVVVGGSCIHKVLHVVWRHGVIHRRGDESPFAVAVSIAGEGDADGICRVGTVCIICVLVTITSTDVREIVATVAVVVEVASKTTVPVSNDGTTILDACAHRDIHSEAVVCILIRIAGNAAEILTFCDAIGDGEGCGAGAVAALRSISITHNASMILCIVGDGMDSDGG